MKKEKFAVEQAIKSTEQQQQIKLWTMPEIWEFPALNDRCLEEEEKNWPN